MRGPPSSRHRRVSVDALSSGPSIEDQSMKTWPELFDSEPYLTALVASSSKIMPKLIAALGGSVIDGPEKVNR